MIQERMTRAGAPQITAPGAVPVHGGELLVADARATIGAAACCRIAARLVASHYDLPLAEIVGRRRYSRRATRARHVAMYLAHVVYGLSLVLVGRGFNRDRTTASYACRMVEDGRDDPAFDAALAGLELSAGVLLELGREGKAT